MKIAFDHQTFTNQTYGGISRYYTILANELLKKGQDVMAFTGLHRNNYVSDLPNGVVKGIKLNRYPPKSGRVFHWLNHGISQVQMKSWQPDVIHETYYSSLPTLKTNALRLTTVYDMIHELFAGQFSPRDKTTKWKKTTFNRVDHIISISHSTKRDLIELFGIPEQKITVVHLGVDLAKFKKIPLILSGFDKPFLLYVGGRSGYKNFSGLLYAIASSSKLKNELDVIAFGGGVFNSQEKQLIKKLGLKEDQVRQVGGTDEVLAALYHQAVAFIYPSLYEGFGLPPLEAMAAGCPVVSSNTSSMPEVIGDAGNFFAPNDIESIRFAIEQVVYSEQLRNDLTVLGYNNIENFSWQKCANQTLGIYKNLMSK
ncbi:TPA: glycosyltransferase family 4 protein [Aeromonas veronii]